MIIHMIAGLAPGRVIGKNNQLPWHYPQDLKHFKEITTGKVVVMGYNTYLSIGKELPNRRNVILSFEPIAGLECYTNIPDMMKKLEEDPEQVGASKVAEIYIMGGMSIYKQFLPKADILHITHIKKEYDGDAFFPEFEDQFVEVDREVHEEMDFVTYKRK